MMKQVTETHLHTLEGRDWSNDRLPKRGLQALPTNFHEGVEDSRRPEEDIAPEFAGFSQLKGTGTQTAS